jgi:hypothetical protein
MLVLAILVVIVSLGIVFLAYFFVNLCRDSRKGHAIVFVDVVGGTAIAQERLYPLSSVRTQRVRQITLKSYAK